MYEMFMMKSRARWWHGGCLFENCQHQTILLFLHFCSFFVLSTQRVAFPTCIAANCSWSFVYYIFILCISLFYYVCIAVLHSLVAGLMARSHYQEGPATGHLGTCFTWFPCVWKRMVRWFPRLQVATACFSCSPPDLNFLDPYFLFMLSLFHIYVHA